MSVILERTTAEWEGTFALVVQAAVNDLRSDGVPTSINLSWEAKDGAPQRADLTLLPEDKAKGTIYAQHYEQVLFIPITDVTRLEF